MIVHRNDHARLQKVSAFPASSFRVRHGVNRGEALGIADDLCPDDVYWLSSDAVPEVLSLDMANAAGFRVVGSETPAFKRAFAHIDAALLFISTDGLTTEALSFVLTDADRRIIDVLLVPLSPLEPGKDYALVSVDGRSGLQRFAQCALVSFAGDTLITRADGQICRVRDLRVGDHLMTRNNESTPIRLLGRQTVQAHGLRAPVLIRAGAFNNTEDLLVSPDHRLLIAPFGQDERFMKNGVMTQARNLVNGKTVLRVEDGFVDYVQIVLDDHDFIMCSGAALETTYIDHLTRHAFDHVDPLVLETLMSRHLASLLQRVEADTPLRTQPQHMRSELRAVSEN